MVSLIVRRCVIPGVRYRCMEQKLGLLTRLSIDPSDHDRMAQSDPNSFVRSWGREKACIASNVLLHFAEAPNDDPICLHLLRELTATDLVAAMRGIVDFLSHVMARFLLV